MTATVDINRRYRIILAVFVVVLSSAQFGCNRGPTIVPVAGKVTIDGKPLDRGMVTVFQTGYRPATAKIESDGSFVFKTLADGDGCLLGEYPITVMSKETLSASKVKFFIPHQYGDVSTSDKKIKIDGATDQLVISLTWEGSGQKGPYIVAAGGNSGDL